MASLEHSNCCLAYSFCSLFSYVLLWKFLVEPVFVAVPRIQFLAIEVARNREGCNDAVGGHKVQCSHTTDASV